MRSTFCRILLPAAMVAAAGCGDLAMNPDQVPAKLALTPEDTLLTAGDAAQLKVLVFDRDDNPLQAHTVFGGYFRTACPGPRPGPPRGGNGPTPARWKSRQTGSCRPTRGATCGSRPTWRV